MGKKATRSVSVTELDDEQTAVVEEMSDILSAVQTLFETTAPSPELVRTIRDYIIDKGETFLETLKAALPLAKMNAQKMFNSTSPEAVFAAYEILFED